MPGPFFLGGSRVQDLCPRAAHLASQFTFFRKVKLVGPRQVMTPALLQLLPVDALGEGK